MRLCQCLGIEQLAVSGKYNPLSLAFGGLYPDSMKTPQQLSREAIDEFRAIYEEEFGEHLSDDQVQEIALRLLRFFGILNDSPDNETTSHQ